MAGTLDNQQKGTPRRECPLSVHVTPQALTEVGDTVRICELANDARCGHALTVSNP
jgi:hypothetical protein